MRSRRPWIESRIWLILELLLCAVGLILFPTRYYVVSAVLLPITLSALYFRMNVRRSVLPRDTRLSWQCLPRGVAIGFVSGLALVLVPIAAQVLAGRYRITGQHLGLVFQWAYVTFALRMLAFAAAEELIYRGFLLETVERRAGSVVAIVASALVFGATHVLLGWTAMISVAIDGLVFGALTIATRSLWASISAHWAFNLVNIGVFGPHLVRLTQRAPPLGGTGALAERGFAVVFGLALLFISRRSDRYHDSSRVWRARPCGTSRDFAFARRSRIVK